MKTNYKTYFLVRIFTSSGVAHYVLLLLVLWCGATELLAQLRPQRAPAPRPSSVLFGEKTQMGIRVGGWSHQGETPRSFVDQPDYSLRADYPATNFYFEGFYGFRLSDPFGVEFSFGTVQRGEVTVHDRTTGNRTFGNVTLYPVRVRGFWYPAPDGLGTLRPYLSAGGSMIVGSDAVQIANQFGYYAPHTEITVGWVAGGGVEFALSPSLVLELAATYQPIRFADPLVFEENFDALAITIGGKYLLGSRRLRK